MARSQEEPEGSCWTDSGFSRLVGARTDRLDRLERGGQSMLLLHVSWLLTGPWGRWVDGLEDASAWAALAEAPKFELRRLLAKWEEQGRRRGSRRGRSSESRRITRCRGALPMELVDARLRHPAWGSLGTYRRLSGPHDRSESVRRLVLSVERETRLSGRASRRIK